MELFLTVATYRDGTFTVYRKLEESWRITTSVLVLDYDWVPWPRKGGNLLW